MDPFDFVTRRPGGTQNIPRPAHWRAGPPAPWQGRDLSVLADHDAVRARLAAVLLDDALGRAANDVAVGGESPRPSAVLVGLLDHSESPALLLTRRADHLRNHRGEVSFPGGRLEAGENVVEAALREAHEEVGLDRGRVRTMGVLPPLRTWVSDSLITPVVGTVAPGRALSIDAGEVARVFEQPLVDLVRDDTYSSEIWSTPRGESTLPFFHLDDETIWGATARIISGLIDLLTAP